jgi:uridine kinase
MDDFHNPRVVRYQISRSSSEGYYLHAFNYAQFRDYVLNPLSKGGTRRYRPKGHDLSTDVTIRDDESQIFEASPAAILIVDGVFLHRKELRDMWDISVYLDVAEETVKARMAGRGDVIGVEDPILQRYLGAHHIYIDECKPQDRATMVVDNSDFSRPVLIRDTR